MKRVEKLEETCNLQHDMLTRHNAEVKNAVVSERQQMLGMMDGYLGAGLEKRAEWGDVWLAPPLCFGLLLDELLGPSAAALFLLFSGNDDRSVSVEAEGPLYRMLHELFLVHKHNISHWVGVLGLGSAKCVSELRRVALRRVEVEKLGDRRGDFRAQIRHRPLASWAITHPHVTCILKRDILCLKIHQMFLENMYSKIAATLEESTKPAQIEAIVKYRQNVIHGHEAAARAAFPMQHEEDDPKSKWRSPGLSTKQIEHQAKLMLQHCAMYSKLPSTFFVSRKLASKRKASDNAHNDTWLAKRQKDTAKPRASSNKRDRTTALSKGAKHSLGEMLNVGKKQATGSAAAGSGIANEDNTGHWSYFNKIKVRGEGACFDDLKTSIGTHHPSFKPGEHGLASSKVKKAWLDALRKHLSQ